MSTFKRGSIPDLAERAWRKSQEMDISPSKALSLIWNSGFSRSQRKRFYALIDARKRKEKEPPVDAVKNQRRHNHVS